MAGETPGTRFFGTFGLSFGVPWHLGKKRHHEIRTGVGIAIGALNDYQYKSDDLTGTIRDQTGMSVLFIFVPEIYYVWHAAKRFALQVGGDVYLGPFTPESFGADSGTDVYRTAEPVFNVFLGFRI